MVREIKFYDSDKANMDNVLIKVTQGEYSFHIHVLSEAQHCLMTFIFWCSATHCQLLFGVGVPLLLLLVGPLLLQAGGVGGHSHQPLQSIQAALRLLHISRVISSLECKNINKPGCIIKLWSNCPQRFKIIKFSSFLQVCSFTQNNECGFIDDYVKSSWWS